MAHTPLILAQLDGDLDYEDGSSGGTGTGTGALRWRDGHTGGVQGALVEEATINYARNPHLEFVTNWGSSWGFTGTATTTQSTEQASDGTRSNKCVATVAAGGIGQQPGVFPAASQGQAWTVSADAYGTGSGDLKLTLTSRTSGNAIITHYDGSTITPPAAWTRYTHTATLADATTAKVSLYLRTVTGAVTFYGDRFQLEQKDHPTTFCPEFDGTGFTKDKLLPGYTAVNAADDGFQYYERAAAKIEIPTAAPDWVACRYSEDLGQSWSFAYTETLTGNNIGTYGKISHDGSDLVIESDRALLVGPLYAGTGSLDSIEQAVLNSEETWTFGMALVGSDAPIVDAGANSGAVQNQLWTQAGSFTDADSAGPWTATVDYDDGDGPEALALDGTSFTLSHTYTSPGTYPVTVTVDDGEGGVGSDTVQVTVTEAPTTGTFVISSVTGTHPTAPRITLS